MTPRTSAVALAVGAALSSAVVPHSLRSTPTTMMARQPGRPPATLLFQNFPNPFPTATSPTTCVWFDLHNASPVRLEVLDLRGERVRTLVPSATIPSPLAAGRYGRAALAPSGDGSGCDPRFSWDARGDNGRSAPPGVYLLRLTADGGVFTRKMLVQPR